MAAWIGSPGSAGTRADGDYAAEAQQCPTLLASGFGGHRIEGGYDEALELLLFACRYFGRCNRTTAFNPFTIAGKKTAAHEIAAEHAPEAADVVVVPCRDGVIISGPARGFADLVRGGLLVRLPRLIAVQPAGSAALALALRAVRESGASRVIVEEEQIVEAIGRPAASPGVFAEAVAAAALAGVLRALEEGLVNADERIVLLVSATGLKDIATAGRALRHPEAIPAAAEAVEELLRRAGFDRGSRPPAIEGRPQWPERQPVAAQSGSRAQRKPTETWLSEGSRLKR